MNPDGSPRVARWLIKLRLCKLRRSVRLSQSQVARHVRYSQGTITNWEDFQKRALPKLAVIEQLLELYDSADEYPTFVEWYDAAEQKSWWEGLSDAMTSMGFEMFLGLEEGATRIDSFDVMVPGLLQTEAYARAVIQGGRIDVDPDRMAELRLKRQEVLTRPQPVRLWAVFDDKALQRTIGDAETRREQLDHLLAMSELPNVEIQVLPEDVGAHPGLVGPFEIMHFGRPIPSMVYLESLIKAVWFGAQEPIDPYVEAMNGLRALALDPATSHELISKRRKEV